MAVARGDVVVIAAPGDFGKPRPAVVVQTDHLNGLIDSVLVCPLTSDLARADSFRITVTPTPDNGLRSVSQIMVEKATAIRLQRVGAKIGRLDERSTLELNRALSFVFGLADHRPR